VLFDEFGYFAGFKFVDRLTKEELLDTPTTQTGIKVHEEYNVEEMMGDIESHTRIVGFRTTKECEGSS